MKIILGGQFTCLLLLYKNVSRRILGGYVWEYLKN